MNLYKLTAELQAAMDRLEVDEETGEVAGFEAVDALDLAFEDKAEAYALTVKNLLAFAAQAKLEAKALRERAEAAERKADRLREHLVQAMAAVGKEKITTPRAALSFRRSRAVFVDDEGLVPDDFFRVEMMRRLDKTAVGKLLRAGGSVTGCRLVENKNLQIK